MLTARRLKVRCPSKTIVHAVDLDFTSGIHCITGTSGAGKTTMLEALSGRSKHDVSGNVLLNDLPVTHKDIQYIPTMPVLFDFMTSREILTFFLHFYPVSKKKLGHLLNIILDVDVDVRLDRLSSGQRKRVQFIILALKECKCRFIDEPFSNMSSGDVQTVMRAIVSLQHISPETITIIITHHHFEFETFTVQRIMLNDGRCSSEQYSPSGMRTEELRYNPLTEQLYVPPCGTWSKMRQVLLSHWLFQKPSILLMFVCTQGFSFVQNYSLAYRSDETQIQLFLSLVGSSAMACTSPMDSLEREFNIIWPADISLYLYHGHMFVSVVYCFSMVCTISIQWVYFFEININLAVFCAMWCYLMTTRMISIMVFKRNVDFMLLMVTVTGVQIPFCGIVTSFAESNEFSKLFFYCPLSRVFDIISYHMLGENDWSPIFSSAIILIWLLACYLILIMKHFTCGRSMNLIRKRV